MTTERQYLGQGRGLGAKSRVACFNAMQRENGGWGTGEEQAWSEPAGPLPLPPPSRGGGKSGGWSGLCRAGPGPRPAPNREWPVSMPCNVRTAGVVRRAAPSPGPLRDPPWSASRPKPASGRGGGSGSARRSFTSRCGSSGIATCTGGKFFAYSSASRWNCSISGSQRDVSAMSAPLPGAVAARR